MFTFDVILHICHFCVAVRGRLMWTQMNWLYSLLVVFTVAIIFQMCTHVVLRDHPAALAAWNLYVSRIALCLCQSFSLFSTRASRVQRKWIDIDLLAMIVCCKNWWICIHKIRIDIEWWSLSDIAIDTSITWNQMILKLLIQWTNWTECFASSSFICETYVDSLIFPSKINYFSHVVIVKQRPWNGRNELLTTKWLKYFCVARSDTWRRNTGWGCYIDADIWRIDFVIKIIKLLHTDGTLTNTYFCTGLKHYRNA